MSQIATINQQKYLSLYEFATDNRISRCSIVPNINSIITYDEYDFAPKLENTRVMKISTFKILIENLHDIVCVCSNLTDNDDGPFTTYYSRFHKIGI